MNYKLKIILFILLLFGLNTKGQIIGPNLVNNPSFEQYYGCPDMNAELYKCKYWWGYSTEYYNVCAPQGSFSVPLNTFGFQYAHSGVAYASFGIYAFPMIPAYRETIKTKLIDSLITNKRYCTNFYISLSDYFFAQNTSMLLDSIGMVF